MASNMTKILPCPFCGEIPEISEYTSPKSKDTILFEVYCTNEDCYVESRTGEKSTKELAIECWNRRIP